MFFTAFLILLLSSYSVQLPEVHSASEPTSRFAMLDDVRILANGLLQLGHGLKDFALKTKDQVNEIFEKISNFDRSFNELSKETNGIKLDEQELKEQTKILQTKNDELKIMSLDLREKLNNIMENQTVLEMKVEGLEDKLYKLNEIKSEVLEIKKIPSLKVLIEDQNKIIKSLMNTLYNQRSNLDNQNHQIQKLEEKIIYTECNL
ncbi:angiopoietin-related protein 3 [Narcine bancroftii]|uniref:angiopoietin-related protein 3 n=1 Tax=Narcine bancroftii TaxID=1343680 RepID=UPI003831042B